MPSHRLHDFIEKMHDLGRLRWQFSMISMRATRPLLAILEILNVCDLPSSFDESLSSEIIFSHLAIGPSFEYRSLPQPVKIIAANTAGTRGDQRNSRRPNFAFCRAREVG